jgi:uncharacterized membrane protein
VRILVVEFKSRKERVLQLKYSRFEELKRRYFMQNLSEDEENEMNSLSQWLKIHN